MQGAKYFDRFKELGTAGWTLRGASLLLEVLPKEELKSRGGIILGAAKDTHKATSEDFRRPLGIVLATGTECTEIKVGDVVLMPFSPLYLSEFPGIGEYTQNTIALTNESDILMVFTDLEKVKEVLSK